MELYVAKLLDLLLRGNKRIYQTHLLLKKIKRDPVSTSKLIVQKHCRNGEYCFFFSNYSTLITSLFYVMVVNTDKVKVWFFFQ